MNTGFNSTFEYIIKAIKEVTLWALIRSSYTSRRNIKVSFYENRILLSTHKLALYLQSIMQFTTSIIVLALCFFSIVAAIPTRLVPADVDSFPDYVGEFNGTTFSMQGEAHVRPLLLLFSPTSNIDSH